MSISTAVGVPLSSSLANLFQNAYTNSLLKNSPSGISNLAAQALNMSVPGSNPINPLQGVSAVTGLNAFVADIQQKAALSKITKLIGGALGGGGAAADPLSQIMSLLGGAGGALGGAAAPNPLALLGAGDVSAAGGGQRTGLPATVVGAQDVQLPGGNAQIIAQLQSMFNMLQALSGGGASPFPGTLPNTVPVAGQQVVGQQQPPATIPPALLLQQQVGGVQQPPPQQVVQQPGLAGFGGAPQAITPQVNFSVVDNAINQTLGSIFSTLPLVKL